MNPTAALNIRNSGVNVNPAKGIEMLFIDK